MSNVEVVKKFLKKLNLRKTELIATYEDKSLVCHKLPKPVRVIHYFENISISGWSKTMAFIDDQGSYWFFRLENAIIAKTPILVFMTDDEDVIMSMFRTVKHNF